MALFLPTPWLSLCYSTVVSNSPMRNSHVLLFVETNSFTLSGGPFGVFSGTASTSWDLRVMVSQPTDRCSGSMRLRAVQRQYTRPQILLQSTSPAFSFFLIPHLLKMVRNCFASKNRHLWVRHSFTISKEGLYVVIVILQFHHPISWSELFMASRHNIESLTVVPKLQYEHVF